MSGRPRFAVGYRSMERLGSRSDHLDKRVPRPLDILLRAVEERREDGQQGNTPAVNSGAVHRVSRNEHEVTCFDPPCLLADSKTTLAFQDQYDFVVIWLNVNDIHTIFKDVDVGRQTGRIV